MRDPWRELEARADPLRGRAARSRYPAHEDHLLPLMIAAGAALGKPGAVHFHSHALGKPIFGFRFG